MGTALLGWELGGGLGHVGKLLEVARGLAEHGHTPVLALKDIGVARPMLRDVPFRVVQAPFWQGAARANFRASSYADILAVKGFDDAEGLGLMVGAWQSLIELTGADLVVCDHAPTLCLAAYGATPSVLVGTGFTVPPSDSAEFPKINPGAEPTMPEGRLLEVVRAVQRRRGRPAPESLPALLAGSARFVLTIAELDTYRGLRGKETVEPFRPPPAPEPAPPPERSTFFAYLSDDYPGVGHVLPFLASAGLKGSAYIRNSPPGPIAAARQAGVTVFDEPPPLGRMLAGVSAILHHGGLNTAEAAVAAGRPQVTLAAHLEHQLNGSALEALGVGKVLAGRTSVQALADTVRLVMAPGGYPERAIVAARNLQSRPYEGCLPRLVDTCLASLS